jgi:riboflavin kinase/FMN adenylyltransferase
VLRWRGVAAVPDDWGRSVVTIGMFDGVHLGHQAVIRRAVARAAELRLPAVLITFEPHPFAVLRPGSEPAVLTGPGAKAELVEDLGVDALLVLPFTAELSRLEPAAFVDTVLVRRLHAAAVVVGENFRFGHRAAGDVRLLTELGRAAGFTVDAVALQPVPGAAGPEPVSSSFVRDRVAAGDVAAAGRALGRPHRLDGEVVEGDGRGRALGYPTVNVRPAAPAAVPADGIYAGWCRSGARRWAAAISVGTNPTFGGSEHRLEAHLLDVTVDLYRARVSLEFVARLRDVATFPDAESLAAAIADDVARTRQVLGLPAAAGPDG